jgi:murein L,D-transpeptidase YafK
VQKQRITLIFALAMVAAAAFGESPAAADRLVVEKSKRQLSVYQNGELIKTYRVALGPQPVGPKIQEGDGRTPEGLYVIDSRNAGSAYNLSLHISYPNRSDSIAAARRGVAPGGDIMIHGLPNGVAAAGENEDWTRGCIAVSNEAIQELWRLIPDQTVIEIRP